MSKRPPRIKDIAAACGVSAMTVSKALRGEKKVAAATRERILREAERIGYRPDPITSRLMSRLRWRREGAVETGMVIGWLDPAGTGAYPARTFRKCLLEGAGQRADRMGYRIERFAFGVDSIPVERLQTILQSRGIEAVIVPPLPAGVRGTDFDFTKFACAAIGFSLEKPVINRVAFNEFSSVTRCLENAVRRGYRRPGFCYFMSHEQPVVRHAVSAWHGFFAMRGESVGVPLLVQEHMDAQTLKGWIKQHAPDVIISNVNLVMPSKAPPLLSFALETDSDSGEGLVRDWAVLGAAAVDMVIAQMHRNETGCGFERKTVLIGGHWRGGDEMS